MATAYSRPFQPLELEDDARRSFPIRAMLEQLRSEDSLDQSGRASLTLVHGPGLTAVLTCARAGTVFGDHQAGGPTLFVVLHGALSIAPDGAAAVQLAEDEAFALGPEVRHVIEAHADSAFLTIIGEQLA